MDLQLQGKVALVVGAAGSMGVALAQRLLDEGAVPVAADLAPRLDQVAFVREQVPLDVTDPASVRRAVADVRQRLGRIDIVVVLAGVYQAKPIVEILPEEWDRLLDINLKGTFLVCKEVLPVMQAQDYGRIVLLASLAGQVGGMVAGAHYAASKAGVLSLVKSLTKQAPQPWITINAISPGPVAGAMTGAWPQADRERMLRAIPLGRFAQPEEIADLALFLSSPRAAYIKGARIDINGGAHLD